MTDFEYIARNIRLAPGDIFCTYFPGKLGKVITKVEAFHARDRKAEFSHAGFLTGPNGETFEALLRLRRQNIWRAYGGSKILIARHPAMTPELFARVFDKIDDHEGALYPAWRLVLHLYPPAARYIATGKFKVCSEWVAYMLWLCDKEVQSARFLDISGRTSWKGVNPDHLADMIHNPDTAWRVVCKVKLPQ